MALKTLLHTPSTSAIIRGVLGQNQSQILLPLSFWGCNQQQSRSVYRLGIGIKPRIREDYKKPFPGKANRHWPVKWRGFRRMKMVPVKLPDFEEHEKLKTMSPEEVRLKMKEKGIAPGRPWMERPFEVSSTGDVFEGYIPPEGDGKASVISTEGAKQSAEMVSKKSKSWLAFRKIRQFEEDFSHSEFLKEAFDIYLNVHKAVAAKDRHWIRQLVTERQYPEVVYNMRNKTVHWKFLESIEPPRIVHARCTDVISKENVFGQVTCRFFTKQILAVYDRFGRLSHGSEVISKDVLEYVVFEKHLANEYGIWRVHAKIQPPWLNNQIQSPKTYVDSIPTPS